MPLGKPTVSVLALAARPPLWRLADLAIALISRRGSRMGPRLDLSARELKLLDLLPRLFDRLFDRFFRADAARGSEDGQHHGLGLAIVAAIARMHGGQTFAESAVGVTPVGFSLGTASG